MRVEYVLHRLMRDQSNHDSTPMAHRLTKQVVSGLLKFPLKDNGATLKLPCLSKDQLIILCQHLTMLVDVLYLSGIGQTGLSDDGVQNGKKFKSYITKASEAKGPYFDGQQQ